MTEEQKYYIIKYKEDLENNDFDKFFSHTDDLPTGMCDVIYKAIPNCLEQMSYIPEHGFSMSDISSIDVPDCVTKIGDYAFYSCTSLTSINIPDSVTKIGDYAFYSCTSLSKITYKGIKYTSKSKLEKH